MTDMDTFNYFTDEKNTPDRKFTDEPYNAYMAKHIELKKLVRLDDGEMVFKEWAGQFTGRTLDDIADEVLAGAEPPFLKSWAATQSHRDWMEANGETLDSDGPFVAVMEYGATGEGQTMQVISAHASSLAHFILYCGEKVGGYYFVIGMDFYRNLEDAKSDRYFSRMVPEAMHGFFQPECNVDINLKYHANCS